MTNRVGSSSCLIALRRELYFRSIVEEMLIFWRLNSPISKVLVRKPQNLTVSMLYLFFLYFIKLNCQPVLVVKSEQKVPR